MLTHEILVCPTCGAEQAWSDTCRRCKCDLALLVDTLHLRESLHQECLRQIDAGDIARALTQARRRWELSPDEEAARLLAVCLALMGHFSLVEQLVAVHDGRQDSK
jgi:hypothetical protein